MHGLLEALDERVTVFPNDRPDRSDIGRLLAMTYGMTVGPRLKAPVDVLHYPLTVPVPRFAGPTVVTLHDLQHVELPSFFFSHTSAVWLSVTVPSPLSTNRESVHLLVSKVQLPLQASSP